MRIGRSPHRELALTQGETTTNRVPRLPAQVLGVPQERMPKGGFATVHRDRARLALNGYDVSGMTGSEDRMPTLALQQYEVPEVQE